MDARMVSRQFQNLLEYQKEQKYIQGDISLHWHNIYEFEIVLSGSGEMICNGKTWQLRRGMVCLLSPADFHEYRDCYTCGWDKPADNHGQYKRFCTYGRFAFPIYGSPE
jgi:hypothetical protein